MAKPEDFLKNEKWLTRLGNTFDQCEKGFISRDENYLTSMKQALKYAPSERQEFVTKANQIIDENLDAWGFIEGVQVDKQKYLELAAMFCAAEAERMKRGEVPLTQKVLHALFDAFDKNNSGCLTYDDYKNYYIQGVFRGPREFKEEDIRAAFDMLDKDKTGKISNKDFAVAGAVFWCKLDSTESDGLFGSVMQ